VHVAQRAAEVADDLRLAAGADDLVQDDVHHFRGRLEVRHAKVFWPLAIRWDRWYVLPTGSPRPTLDDVMRSVGPNVHLWLDLKGFDPRLPSMVVEAIADRPRTTVSSRSWWILPRQGLHRNVRVVHSVGSRLQLRALRRRAPASIEAVAIDRRLLDAESMAALRRVTSTVFVWGIHDVEQGLHAVEAGADGLIVDGIGTIEGLRDRLAPGRERRKAQVGRTLKGTPPLA
jgi:glycerophosphoryl diester phosphodiesterase